MLNTLYPPVTSVQPTALLTPKILTAQRNGFFRYITGVQKHGPGLLSTLIADGKRAGEETGWTAVRETVERYLRAANQIIDDCFEVNGRDSLLSTISEETEENHRRKVDSGVSFSSSSQSSSRHRPSTSGSTGSTSVASKRDSREKAGPDIQGDDPRSDSVPTRPAGSTLERIARELRKIKSKSDVREAARPHVDRNEDETASSHTVREKKVRLRPSLRKMRSTSALGDRDRNKGDDESFDVDEMKRQRLIWEANQRKGKLQRAPDNNESDGGRARKKVDSVDSMDME